jgi:hypothetical protein
VRSDEQGEKIERVWKLAASPQMESDRRPPRIFDHIIEMMFPLPVLGRFNLYARLLSIQSIDDAKYESSEDSKPDPANDEGHRRAASDNEICNRNLVWCDSRFAKKRDDCRFDRCVNVSR